MKKPKAEIITRWDYYKALKYVFHQQGWFYDGYQKRLWNNWLIEYLGNSFTNGGTIHIPGALMVMDNDPDHEFLVTVITTFHQEFGDNANYYLLW